MFKLFGVLFAAIIDIITSLVGITESVDNVVASANHASGAMRKTAAELESDVEFECEKKQFARDTAKAQYKLELLAMTEED